MCTVNLGQGRKHGKGLRGSDDACSRLGHLVLSMAIPAERLLVPQHTCLTVSGDECSYFAEVLTPLLPPEKLVCSSPWT